MWGQVESPVTSFVLSPFDDRKTPPPGASTMLRLFLRQAGPLRMGHALVSTLLLLATTRWSGRLVVRRLIFRPAEPAYFFSTAEPALQRCWPISLLQTSPPMQSLVGCRRWLAAFPFSLSLFFFFFFFFFILFNEQRLHDRLVVRHLGRPCRFNNQCRAGGRRGTGWNWRRR